MAEYETIQITNPTKEAFSCRFNGEMYTLQPSETRSYPQFLSFHIAKHLSNKMLDKEARKLMEQFKENPFVPQVSVLMNHDNPSRRIALYDIFSSRESVEACLKACLFKSFVGEMTTYDTYVAKKELKEETSSEPAPSTSKEKKEKKTE